MKLISVKPALSNKISSFLSQIEFSLKDPVETIAIRELQDNVT